MGESRVCTLHWFLTWIRLFTKTKNKTKKTHKTQENTNMWLNFLKSMVWGQLEFYSELPGKQLDGET